MYRGSIKGKISNMDKDLAFMTEIGNENLATFVDVLIEKGGITETLSVSDEYKAYGKDYSRYWDRIELEFREFGSNTFINIFGEPNEYKEILRLVLKKMNVKFKKVESIEELEEKLLEKLIHEIWDELEGKDRIEFLKKLEEFNISGLDSLMDLFKAGGIIGASMATLITEAIATTILTKSVVVYTTSFVAQRSLSAFAGPVGVVLGSAFGIVDITGPAYRVIVPCTILIAAFRKMYNSYEF